MFRKFVYAMFALGLLFGSFSINAQETEKQKMIMEIINQSDVMAQMDTLKKTMAQQMQTQMSASGINFTEEQSQRFFEIVFEGMDEIIAETIPATVRFYDEGFSEDEIREIYDYTMSPTGKKVMSLLPEFTNQLMQDMSPKIMERMPAMQEKIMAFIKEISENK